MSKTHLIRLKPAKLKSMCKAICNLSNGQLRLVDNQKYSSLQFKYVRFDSDHQYDDNDNLYDSKYVWADVVSSSKKSICRRHLDMLEQIMEMKRSRYAWKVDTFSCVPDFDSLEELALKLAVFGY